MGTAFVAIDHRRKLVGVDRQRPARDLLGFGPGRERNLLCDDAQLRHRGAVIDLRGRGEYRRVLWRPIERRAEHDHHRRSSPSMRRSAAPPIVIGPAFGKYRPQLSRRRSRPTGSARSPAGLAVRGPDRSRSSLLQRHRRRSRPDRRASSTAPARLISTIGGQKQTETVGIGDGSSVTWCSAAIYCANHGSGALAFNAAGLTGAIDHRLRDHDRRRLDAHREFDGRRRDRTWPHAQRERGHGRADADRLHGELAPIRPAGPARTRPGRSARNQGTIGSSGSPVTLNVALAGGAAWPNSNVIAGGFPIGWRRRELWPASRPDGDLLAQRQRNPGLRRHCDFRL